MPRNESIEQIINAAAERVVQRIVPAIQRALAEAQALGAAKTRPAARRSAGTQRGRPRGEMTRWVADNRARRVPIFVIEATGLDTKKKIVAKFGSNVTFEKGKPLPPALAPAANALKIEKARAAAAARVVARPQVVRKAAAAR